MIIKGDCIEEMKKLDENSVEAIITDPPYGLEFMGKDWDKFKHGNEIINPQGAFEHKKGFKQMVRFAKDYETMIKMQQFFFEWATECLRILKPGGFLLSFGGTRTYHRLVCGIEDAGFEIRDTIMWLYGSGFPKSLNIGKQIDKIQGNEREVVGEIIYPDGSKSRKTAQTFQAGGNGNILGNAKLTKGNSPWEGWGTALKPANEPIVVARKPLSEKNVALNVLKWGTGGINIDGCRIGFKNQEDEKESKGKNQHSKYPNSIMRNPAPNGIYHEDKRPPTDYIATGRFPANIILDEEAGKMLDEQSGDCKPQGNKLGKELQKAGGIFGGGRINDLNNYKDKGGASRFFYCAKASKSEREKHNNHPTVKPIKLMEYLIKLVSRKGAIVLDPFLGSGTTAIACLKLERQFIGIEKEEEYIKICEARIKPFMEQTKLIANNSHQTKPPKTIGENRLGARDKTGDTYIKCTNDS